MVNLPSAENVATLAVAVLAGIVAWDAYWLASNAETSRRWVNPEGGFAWESEGVHEMVRQWAISVRWRP